MFQPSPLSCKILIFLKIVSLSVEAQYEFEFEDDQIYSKCLDNPNDAKGIEGLFDLSDFTMELGEDGVLGSGNLTTVWEVEPTDRVEIRINILHWERGFWQPTILNAYIFDFCKVMYDKNQLWYGIMTEHVINVEEVKDKCITYKGTTLMYEPNLIKAQFVCGMIIPYGRHRIIVNVVAIDFNNVTRPNEICYELRGQFHKILN